METQPNQTNPLPGTVPPQPETPQRGMLDEFTRHKILKLISNGSSRRVAARFIGCAPSTITRTAARDPQFAAQLARAEEAGEVDLVKSLRVASRDPRYWRAGAWLLERKNPDEYTVRPQVLFTSRQVGKIFAAVANLIVEGAPEHVAHAASQRLQELLRGCEEAEISKREWETGEWLQHAERAASGALWMSPAAPQYDPTQDSPLAEVPCAPFDDRRPATCNNPSVRGGKVTSTSSDATAIAANTCESTSCRNLCNTEKARCTD